MRKEIFNHEGTKSIVKSVVLTIMLVSTVVINIGCSKNIVSFNSVKIESSDTDKKVIACDLFEKYLQQYLDEDISDKLRITEYRVTGIKVKEERENGFIFVVEYEVTPYDWQKYDISEKERVTWEKLNVAYGHAYVDVENISNTYKIIDVDTEKLLDQNDWDLEKV